MLHAEFIYAGHTGVEIRGMWPGDVVVDDAGREHTLLSLTDDGAHVVAVNKHNKRVALPTTAFKIAETLPADAPEPAKRAYKRRAKQSAEGAADAVRRPASRHGFIRDEWLRSTSDGSLFQFLGDCRNNELYVRLRIPETGKDTYRRISSLVRVEVSAAL